MYCFHIEDKIIWAQAKPDKNHLRLPSLMQEINEYFTVEMGLARLFKMIDLVRIVPLYQSAEEWNKMFDEAHI